MSQPQPIGYLDRTGYGNYRARCVECAWTLDQSDQHEAITAMRGHAIHVHPRPIPVYHPSED